MKPKDEHTFKPQICEGTKKLMSYRGGVLKSENEVMGRIESLIKIKER